MTIDTKVSFTPVRVVVRNDGLYLQRRGESIKVPASEATARYISQAGMSVFDVLIGSTTRQALNISERLVLSPSGAKDRTLTPDLIQGLNNMPLLLSVLPGQKMQVLFLRLAEDLSNMKIYAIKKHGAIPLSESDIVPVAQIERPTLLYPTAEISALPSEQRDIIYNLYRYGNYITEMDQVFIEWNASQDRNVWGPSIDTVYMLYALRKHGLFNENTRKVAEIGTGNGMLAKAAVIHAPNLEQIEITDIELTALACAERNIKVNLRDGVYLAGIHAPGLRKIDRNVDLLISNPPYVPKPKAQETNPYEGTGLIREVVAEGLSHLNPNNPEAAIMINISSLALKDFHDFIRGRDDLRVERLESLTVPLKINWTQINPEWMDFLIKECGLELRDPSVFGYKFWHTLHIYKLSIK